MPVAGSTEGRSFERAIVLSYMNVELYYVNSKSAYGAVALLACDCFLGKLLLDLAWNPITIEPVNRDILKQKILFSSSSVLQVESLG